MNMADASSFHKIFGPSFEVCAVFREHVDSRLEFDDLALCKNTLPRLGLNPRWWPVAKSIAAALLSNFPVFQ